MVVAAGAFAHRVFVPDAANETAFLRVTYHEPERLFVVSTWQGDLCTAAIRVPVESAPELIALLANGLGAAATQLQPSPSPPSSPSRRGWRARLAGWLSRTSRRAPVIPLRP